MEINSLLDLLMKGSFTVLILVICSIISFAVVIDKYISLKILKEKFINDFSQKINKLVLKKDFEQALEELENLPSTWMSFKLKNPLREVFTYILLNFEKSKEDLLESAYKKLDVQMVKLEKGLNVLATLGSISPFIGLFGTVIGIIKAFESLSSSVSFNYSNVMAGIAEALISTAAGLFVAIPSVMFYNYFSKRIKNSLPYFDEAVYSTVTNVIELRAGQKQLKG